MRKFREHLRKRLPGVLARSDRHQIGARMREEKTHEVFAGVTGSANNGDGNFFEFAHDLRAAPKAKDLMCQPPVIARRSRRPPYHLITCLWPLLGIEFAKNP